MKKTYCNWMLDGQKAIKGCRRLRQDPVKICLSQAGYKDESEMLAAKEISTEQWIKLTELERVYTLWGIKEIRELEKTGLNFVEAVKKWCQTSIARQEFAWIKQGKYTIFVKDQEVADLALNGKKNVYAEDLNFPEYPTLIRTKAFLPIIVYYDSDIKTYLLSIQQGKYFSGWYQPITKNAEAEDWISTFCGGQISEKPLGYKTLKKCTKFAVGLILYMQAFPECVHEGCPDDMTNGERRYTKDAKVRSISVSPKVKQFSHNGTIPHFRCGSWHVLRADRYKRNPDGTPQIKWWPPCYVHKDRSKTVDMEEAS